MKFLRVPATVCLSTSFCLLSDHPRRANGAGTLVLPRRVLNIQNFPLGRNFRILHNLLRRRLKKEVESRSPYLLVLSLSLSLSLSVSLCLSLSLSVSFSLILARGLSHGSIAPCTVCGRQIWFYENHGIVWKMWIIVSFWILLGCDSICHNAVRSLWFLQEELTRSW